MSTPSARRISGITRQQCLNWSNSDGSINPVTGARINPNLTTPNSANVLISQKCLEYGIERPGNRYVPIATQNRTSPSANNSTSRNSNGRSRTYNDSPESSTLSKRKSGTAYINKYGDIKINDKLNFKMEKLTHWWNDGVMKGNDKIHMKNPKTNKSIDENAGTYNRLLQQADAICLIPIDLDFAPNLSQESVEILQSLRNEISNSNQFGILRVLEELHPTNIEIEPLSQRLRVSKYKQYIFRFNSEYRKHQENQSRNNLNGINSMDRKSISYGSISEEDDIDIFCVNTFSDIDTKYKKFKNKMIRTCNDIKNNVTLMSDDKIENIIKTFHQNSNYSKQNINNITDYPAIISLTIAIASIQKTLLQISDKFINVINLKYNEELNEFLPTDGVDLGGLRASFFNDAVNDLFEMKILIQAPNSTKYVFNPNFKFQDNHISMFIQYFTDIGDVDVAVEKLTNILYVVIGKLLSFMILNNYKLPHHLSSFMLNNFKYKMNKIKDHEHVSYALNDFPDVFNPILNLMKEDPENIESIGMEYNDMYEIQKDNNDGDPITSENLQQFVIDSAKHVNLNNCLPKSHKGNDIDNSFMYEKFAEGIDNDLRKLLQFNNISFGIIDKILTYEEMDNIQMAHLSDNITKNIRYIKNEKTVDDSNEGERYQNDYISYMNNILLNKDIGLSDSEHKEFIKKLLMFWTGFYYYKPEIEYKLLIELETKKGYPVSHTCFNRIDIPRYDTQKEFFQKLKESTEMSYNTFQIAGSKQRKKTLKNQRKINTK